MVDISNPMERFVLILAVIQGLDPKEISELYVGYRSPDNRYVNEEIGRYMEWRSGLVWDDNSGGKLVVRIEDGSLISFYDNEWMLDNMVTDIDFDSLSELYRMLFGPSE